MEWTAVVEPADDEPEVRARKFEGFHPWDLLVIVDVVLLGTLLLFDVISGPATTNPLAGLDPWMTEALFWFNSATTLVLMGGIPILWASLTRVGGWDGAMHYLGMRDRARGIGYWIGIGCLLAVGLAAAALGFGYLLEVLGADPGGDPLFEQVARDGSWFLMIGIAVSAGVGEEILFRGVLQKWLRWWGQALVFGVAHINQGYWAVGFIVGLSGLLGYLRQRRVPLWSLMIAHFAYDLILLTILKLQVT